MIKHILPILYAIATLPLLLFAWLLIWTDHEPAAEARTADMPPVDGDEVGENARMTVLGMMR